MRYLSDPRAATALAAEGYDVRDLPASLMHLAARITLASSNAAESAYDGNVCTLARNRHCDTGCTCEFPHEIGYFLGYPYDDVYEFIPSPNAVVNNAARSCLTGYIYSALVDSFCSEQSARMTAMNAADQNAEELLKDLSVQYDRARQAAITQEITEVSAGERAQRSKKEKEG